jgi:formylglycine-generating enzyme required for sulfatase activity
MKILFRLTFVLLVLVTCSFSLKKKKLPSYHDVNLFHKNFVKVSPRLYACKFETTNIDYLYFVENVKYRMNPAVYHSLIPDTTRWSDPGFNNINFVRYYFEHPAYASFPIVNISYEQANFYCNWLSQQYNNHPKRPFKKVAFKLPSKKEWIQAAAGSKTTGFIWGESIEELPKKMKVNFCSRNDSMTFCLNKYPDEVYLKPYKQNALGMYHLSGNVSEMVNTKGDCIGGNYRSQADWLRLDAPNEFFTAYKPCPLVGFRIFMQVIEE